MSPPALPPVGPTYLERALRWFAWCALAFAIVLASAYLAIRHFVWPNLDRWRPEIAQRLTDAAGRPVSIGEIASGFDGLRPWLIVHDLALADSDGQRALAAGRVRAVLSLRAAIRGELRLALLEIDAPLLRVERIEQHRLRIGGFEFDTETPARGDAVERLFAQRKIVLRKARVDWVDRVTGETARASDVDVAIGSVGRQHRASIHVPAWPDVAGPLDAALEFRRPPFVRAGDWRQWHGDAYVGARGIELPALLREWRRWSDVGPIGRMIPESLTVATGQAQIHIWSRFAPDEPLQATLKVDAGALRARFGGDEVPLASLRAHAHASRDAAGHVRVIFPLLELESDTRDAVARFDDEPVLEFGRDARPVAARFSLGRFDASQLHDWLTRIPLPADVRDRLVPLEVAGTVDRLVVDWSSQQPDPRLAVDLAFERLSVARHESAVKVAGHSPLPSFANVSGSARLTRSGGSATLYGESVVLRFPGVFQEPALALDRIDAQATWTLDGPAGPGTTPGIDLHIAALRFANADATGEISGHYRSGGKGAGLVDLRGSLERADAARTARYLPLAIPVRVREWVRDAVLAGHSDDVRFVLQGDLEDFPYRDPASGQFNVDVRLADARLMYAPGWPAIDRIGGTLRFERAGVAIEATAGAIWGVALADTHARIADFDQPLLRVEGNGTGPAQDMIRFLNESALRARIDDFTRDTRITGRARLQLALAVPLDDLDATRVAGSVVFAGNDLELDRTLPPFGSVSGSLAFTQDRLVLRDFRAKFLGGELRVEGETPEPGRLRLQASASIPAAGLVQVHDNALTRRLSGSSDFRADIEVHDRASKVIIESDLVGLASDLPAPFAKSADARWPLRIESMPSTAATRKDRPGRDALRVSVRDDLHLLLERERDAGSERLLVRRGALAVGADPVVPATGFAVLLRTPVIDLDAWSELLDDDLVREAADASRESFAKGFTLVPDTVSLVSPQVHLGGKTLHDVVLGATRSGASWRANVHARGIDGYFGWSVPESGPGKGTSTAGTSTAGTSTAGTSTAGTLPAGTLTARFTRLSIPSDRIGDLETLLESTPGRLPALDISAEELILNDRALGTLELKATNAGTDAAPVWRMQRLRIRNEAATLDATGSWQTHPGVVQRTSAMDFELTIVDAGRLLTLFDFHDVLLGGAGKLGGQVRWVGSPMRLDDRTLAGDVDVSLGKGQFLKSEPGIAKLIGVVNLQSLRRRLVFDFRDVFAEGFAFDEIDGKVRVSDGVARTDDFRMRGVAAQVRISGEADIARETQSLLVRVRPELNAGLASLAYAAIANPVIGLGSFVAQIVLREPLQEMFTYEYDVTGPWDDPQVTRRARAPATTVVPDVPDAPSGTP